MTLALLVTGGLFRVKYNGLRLGDTRTGFEGKLLLRDVDGVRCGGGVGGEVSASTVLGAA